MKPSQRNAFQRKIKDAENEASRIKRAIQKFVVGSFVYKKLSQDLEKANQIVASLKEDFNYYKNR